MPREPHDSVNPQQPWRSPILAFFLLAFAISWIGYVPLLLASRGSRLFANPLWYLALILPGFGPAAAALIVDGACATETHSAKPVLVRLKRAFLKPVPLRWWVVALVGPLLLASAGALMTRYALADSFRPTSSLEALLVFWTLSCLANPCEEIGWRGFAQRRLQERCSPLTSALIVGGLWALWHVPLFLISSGPMAMASIPFWTWAAGVPPQAIILAWLYNRTAQSLATVSLFHILTNVFLSLFVTSTAADSTLRILAAILLVAQWGPDLALGGKRIYQSR